ncbi:hypothetical protein K1719_004690 [Acacia pycnantha]|nr:hypothetical protein K1719_004690 [Acacia pycnantha]
MTRLHEISTLLHASRLLQQFIVDGYTMIESQRLLWVRTHQKELRVDLYQGLANAVLSGETNGATIGKRIILPSSFTGGSRYMIQNYQDAMAICRSEGYPDLFLTFTCNPAWPEIQRFCRKHSIKPCDRPDILARIFKIKLDCLMKTIKEEKYFGTIRAAKVMIELWCIFDGATNEQGEANVDEIKQYYNCRYISACEGSWRIFGFNIHHRNPSVERLSFHLPNQQHFIYSNRDDVVELLDKPRVSESQFLAWMEKNKTDAFC